MPALEDKYVSFRIGGADYLVPLGAVERILPAAAPFADARGALAVVTLGQTAEPTRENGKLLLLREQSAALGLVAEEIDGVVSLDGGERLDMPPSIVDAANRHIGGAVYWRASRKLSLLLRVHELWGHAATREE